MTDERHPAEKAADEVLDELAGIPDDQMGTAEAAARMMRERWESEQDHPEDAEPTPAGVYLVNATGDMTPLATEDGSGDDRLFAEVAEDHGLLGIHPEVARYARDLLKDDARMGYSQGATRYADPRHAAARKLHRPLGDDWDDAGDHTGSDYDLPDPDGGGDA